VGYTQCNYEIDFCSGFNTGLGSVDWEWRSADQIVSVGTGPTRDHSLNSDKGHFIYLDGGKPNNEGDNAVFAFPTIQASTTCRMTFWYHMVGRQIGALNIYTRTQDGGPWTKRFSRETELPRDYFARGEVDLTSTANFQVLIEGVVGGYEGDIAFDDVSFNPGCLFVSTPLPPGTTPPPSQTCPNGQVACDDGVTCIPESKVCDFVNDCPSGLGDENVCATCDFEKDRCGWTDTSPDAWAWYREPVTAITDLQGPDRDHNPGLANGNVMHIDRTHSSFMANATLESGPLGATGLACQMSFWLYLAGSGTPGSVTVRVLKKWNERKINYHETTISGNQGNDWKQVIVNIAEQNAEFGIQFVGSPSDSAVGTSDISIDDIQMMNCDPSYRPPNQNNINCDFEVGSPSCGWYQENKNDDFDWKVGTGLLNNTVGPDYDNTVGVGGGYMYIDPADVTVGLNCDDDCNARIITYPQPPSPLSNGYTCVEFYYYMYGPDPGSLRLTRINHSNNNAVWHIWKRIGSQGNRWNYASFRHATDGVDWSLYFTATRGTYDGDIAIDDVKVTYAECPQRDTECDFEQTSCHGNNDNTDDGIDWTRLAGPAPHAATTGPSADHTLQNDEGHYWFAPLYDVPVGHRTRFRSQQQIKTTTPQCLYFWYHMYGDGQGTMNVYLQENGDTIADSTTLWSRSGNAGNQWRLGKVPIPITKANNFRVVWEAIRGNTANSDMAIDDYKLYDRECPEEGFCDFETDQCGWSNYNNEVDGLDWIWASGNQPSRWNGPNLDHTTGTAVGSYMYIEGSGVTTKQFLRAWFVSEAMQPTGAACITFWYHMYGAGDPVGSLNVYVQVRRRCFFNLTGRVAMDTFLIVCNRSTIYPIHERV